MGDCAQKELVDSLASAMASRKYHDLVIRCGERKWEVHRVIVCLRSKFFEKACDGDFKEGISGTIDLRDDDPDTVNRMLEYLYTIDYKDDHDVSNPFNPRTMESSLVVNANVYAIAEKYDVRALKSLAEQKFAEALETQWNSDSLPVAVEIVYTTTPSSDRGLRDCITRLIERHRNDLLKKKGFLQAVGANGDFAIDVVKAVTD